MTRSKSVEAFKRGLNVFPDGTTRITIERDPYPIYAARGEGAALFDVDGRRFLDLHGNFTALINGHAFAPVVEAVTRQLRDGTCFANPTEAEIALAALICGRIPGVERLRFVNSGTEAVMFAVKAARAMTGRPAIAKIEGAYHGGYDWVEVSQTSASTNWGPPHAPANTSYYRGMPERVLDDVVTLRFNDAEGAAALIEQHADRLAAVLLDPMPSRAGLIEPTPAFVTAIQQTAARHGVLVIADEVLNLRQSYHGASARIGLKPDIVALGKIIGGGFPIGAIGGLADIMDVFSKKPGGPLVPQGGTFSANPVSMVAGRAGMEALTPAVFDRLAAAGDTVRSGLRQSISRHGLSFSVTGAASLLRVHAKAVAPLDYRDAVETPAERAAISRYVNHFIEAGLLVPASGMICLSTPMTEEDLQLIIETFDAYAALEAQQAT
ncbi:aspartate aminotransferase family protein [Chelatococcus asaccharovorans]|uniref:Glutamate-1-semialdehyde 2,1-aminomutase n=1 Tax=Chelatococcus asaccharovorans TaxID=28210 RepID=A0A2V3U519_9HYPH|nr:aspartate aminotransferase family protein [Chelatococcus asaccharovorans]MBS7703715.1 aspartate aminotransferase family protein [Chelatococcus asaccharovorans]PXW57873.1 glutamate-1-semialdehyde 2,1-aminomutase [Chelatococcus asaccharovorans]